METMAPTGNPALDDPRVAAMALRVLPEATLTHGNGTQGWAYSAVKCVFKVVKKSGCADAFYDAVMRDETNTKCCPSHNEKLQLGYGRVNLFVLKLFRFPCLRYETQIKSTLSCRYPLNPDHKMICLNPRHFRWVQIPRVPIPPIVVNKNADYGEPPVRNENPFDDAMETEKMSDSQIIARFTVPNVTMKGDEIKILYEKHAAEGDMNNFQETQYPGQMFDGGASTSSTTSLTPSVVSPIQPRQEADDEAVYYRSGLSSPASDIASPHIYMPRSNADQDMISLNSEMMGADNFETEEDMMDESNEQNGNQNGTQNGHQNGHQNGGSHAVVPNGRCMTPTEGRPLFRSSPSELAELVRNAAFECVEYLEDPTWLSLSYFEESEQIGQTMSFDGYHCLIDGYTATENGNKDKNRFSVGFYNNPSREKGTSEIRDLIGKGVRLYLLAGEVFIENLCCISVFVQSICANMKNGFQLNTVSKLPPNTTMKLFDMRLFSKQLAAAAEKTYQDVYALSRMCSVRISFCKGWGVHYHRSTVLRSPIWFQLHLHNPMAWIDSVLTSMGAPPRMCTSRS